jgi:Asp-tRNA(Asn)/Glu-tRNA(Gln) amidotransferase A subunit family amidase
MIAGAIKFAVGVIFVCFLLSVTEQKIDVTKPSVILGDTTYDIEHVKAPVVSGPSLRAFAWLGTETPLGHVIRRFLLLDNGMTKLRELAAQMPETPPLHHPMYRLNPAETAKHAAAEGEGLTSDSLVPFPPAHALFTAETSDVLAMHEAFKASSHEAFKASSSSPTVTPTVVASKILAAIPSLQEKYRMFSTHPLVDSIESAAAASTLRYAAGAPLSIWDGVPVAFKDMIPVEGYVMTDGSMSNTGGRNQTKDDLLVQRFRELGAIVLPPTSMTEGGVTPVGYSTYIRGAFNPYDKDYYSGGSSAGSAVAVALGLCPVAIGFDGGGSIRTPASLSGVLGLATGYGRLPFSSHMQGTLIKAGPFARKMADLVLSYAVMARHTDEHNFFGEMYNGDKTPTALLNEFLNNDAKDLKGVTMGVFKEWFDDADAEVVQRNRQVLDELVKRGATVKDIRLPNMNTARMSHAIKITSEFAIGWDSAFSAGADLEPATRITVALGSTSTALEVLAAEKVRRFFFNAFEDIYNSGVDVIVTPTTGVTAPKIPANFDFATSESNTPLSVDLLKFVFPGNFLGLPGVACPIGFDKDGAGMPMSMLFNGRQWEEDKVLRLSQSVADIVAEKGWADRVPGDMLQLL